MVFFSSPGWYDPVAFSLWLPWDHCFHIRWYGICYVIGFIMAEQWARFILLRYPFPFTSGDVGKSIVWIVVGVVVGGRLGYCLLYDYATSVSHPLSILAIRDGGMAFHGGLIGVILCIVVFCYRHKIPLVPFLDMLALCVPLGIIMGRIGNYINAEHMGRITQCSWGVLFPGECFLRHPSQLYEACLEGVVCFVSLNLLALFYNKKPGFLGGSFLILYSLCRFFCEFFREMDLPHLTLWGLTYGQMLSCVQIFLGIVWLMYTSRRYV